MRGLLLAAMLVLAVSPLSAQASSAEPVAGYVIDLRGVTSGLPKETAFFPGIPFDTIVPARGFGVDAGGHVYLFTLGPSRVGVGAAYLRARGTAPGIVTDVSAVAPQVSFNFGSVNGWSYLSAGIGRAWVTTTAERDSGARRAGSGGLSAQNYGGGARWFLARRVGVGFDVRFHRVSGPTKTSFFAASVGFSLR